MPIAAGRRNHRKDEPQHQADCLVRWICNLPSLNQRRNFLDKFEARHGKMIGARVRDRVKLEWNRRTYE